MCAVGAQPSDRVAYLLWRAGLLPAPPLAWTPTRWVPRAVLREEAKQAKKAYSTAAASAAAPCAAARAAVPVAPRTLGLGGSLPAAGFARLAAFSGFARAPTAFR